MPTWKLILEYHGGRYRGWQSQDNARTVQGILAAAAADLFNSRIELGGAGRTDAGVHALRQAAHLRSPIRRPSGSILDGLNHRLPAAINILSVEEVADRFHARHDAVGRYYLYQISMRRTALAKDLVWWVKDPLDLAAMERAVRMLPGRHDFGIYQDRRVEPEKSTLVVVQAAQVRRDGDLLLIRLGASHFLWRMVRRIVGVLVRLGTGRFSLDAFTRTLQGEGPDVAEWTAPASGLFLECVLYPGDPPPDELRPVVQL
jgi:tRNA pseudouridine38-40 synthase